MIQRTLFFVVIAFISFSELLPEESSYSNGILEVTNPYTPFLIFLNPIATSADIKEHKKMNFKLDVSQSNIFIKSSGTRNLISYYDIPQNRTIIDMEVTQVGLFFDLSLFNFIELGVKIPIYYFSGGFMDAGIQTYHNSLGLPNAGRETEPNFGFQYEINSKYRNWINVNQSTGGLGDSTLRGKVKVLDQSTFLPMITILGAVKAPTGSMSNGTGSGSPDASLGILFKKSFNFVHFYLNLAAVKPGMKRHLDDISIRPYFLSIFSMEVTVPFFERLSYITQINYDTSPYSSNNKRISDPATLFTVGIKLRLHEKLLFQTSFMEDLTHRTTPDFMFHTAIEYRL